MRYGVLMMLVLAAMPASAERLVVAGGTATEILFALGAGADIVAVDSTSLWPQQVRALPNIGYVRTLSAEGILALHPDRVLLGHEAGPPPTVATLKHMVPTVQLAPINTPAELPAQVRQLGTAVGKTEAAEQLAARLEQELEALHHVVAAHAPNVLVLLAAGPRGVLVAGRDTPAAELLSWLGLGNSADSVQGYKPMSAEAMLALQPDLLVVAETEPGNFHLENHAALRLTPAVTSGRVLVADAMWLLGMGPRLPEALVAIRDLAAGKPGLAWQPK